MQFIKKYGSTILTYSLLILVVVGVVSYYLHKHTETKKAETKLAEETSLKNKQIDDFRNNSGAVVDWDKNAVFSYQIEERLTNARSIYFTSSLTDIYKKDGDYWAVFEPTTVSFQSIFFVLKVKPDDLQILQSDFKMYAIVAKINSISRNELTITGQPDGEGGVDLNQHPSNTITATGDIIKAMELPNNLF